jgi:CHAD domain-containing protein
MSSQKNHIQSLCQRVERDLVKVWSKQDAASVHRFRSDARRLQTVLEELAPEAGRQHKKLLKVLGRIRKRAGKVRDLDVQLVALRSLKIPQEPRRKSQLMNNLIELRAEHEKKLRKTLSKQVVRETGKRLKRASKDLKSVAADDALAVARKMLGPAPTPRARDAQTEDLLHHYRIVGKRARYIAELGAESAETTEFMAQLKRMQDAAGDWHDWFILTRTAANRLGDVHESSLVAALHNVTGAKFRNAVTALSALRAAQTASEIENKPAHRPEHRPEHRPASLARRGTKSLSRKTNQPPAATAA